MTKILVSGSTAFDNIMQSDTNLKDHLIEKEIGNINISYLVTDLKKENGGTGANIAYNLALLGTEPILLTSIGKDFVFSDFMKENVNLHYVNISDSKLTARSYITTDSIDSQITAFYPGAMDDSCDIDDINEEGLKYAIVSANHINIMKKHLDKLNKLGVKTFFDPGQQITQMTKDDLEYCFKLANYIILNEYEYEVIKKISEKTDGEMIDSFDNMILTYGIKGSKIFDSNYNILEIHGVENPNFVDATGAGDAYRAGLLKGLNDGYSWEKSARIGAVLASLSTQEFGAQKHSINWNDFEKLYAETFGENLN